jgi:hypothetical protein
MESQTRWIPNAILPAFGSLAMVLVLLCPRYGFWTYYSVGERLLSGGVEGQQTTLSGRPRCPKKKPRRSGVLG